MDLHFEELLGQITDFIKTEAKTETVVGEQFELGQFKCVPVIKVGMGFGSGGGEGVETKTKVLKGQGAGGGAGVGIEPIGFLVTKVVPAAPGLPTVLVCIILLIAALLKGIAIVSLSVNGPILLFFFLFLSLPCIS